MKSNTESMVSMGLIDSKPLCKLLSQTNLKVDNSYYCGVTSVDFYESRMAPIDFCSMFKNYHAWICMIFELAV